MVEGRYEAHITFSGKGNGVRLAFVERVADQHDIDGALAEHFYLVDLLLWCDRRHVYRAADTQVTTGKRKSLCMIAGTRANYAATTFFFRKTLDKVIGASQFVRPNDLQVLPFQVDFGIILF